MRYYYISEDDMTNGDGLRVVLWLAGCTNNCYNCQNLFTQDYKGEDSKEFDDEAKKIIFSQLEKDYISGITFSGGDPLYVFNRDGVIDLIKEIKMKFPNKTIWLYTGFNLIFEDGKWVFIDRWGFRIYTSEWLRLIDVVCCGMFNSHQREKDILEGTTKHWVGDSRQLVVDVKATLESGEIKEV